MSKVVAKAFLIPLDLSINSSLPSFTVIMGLIFKIEPRIEADKEILPPL